MRVVVSLRRNIACPIGLNKGLAAAYVNSLLNAVKDHFFDNIKLYEEVGTANFKNLGILMDPIGRFQ